MRYRELSVRERAMLVGWWLAKEGEDITSAQLARKLGCHRVTAWRLLRTAERVLPVRVATAERRR